MTQAIQELFKLTYKEIEKCQTIQICIDFRSSTTISRHEVPENWIRHTPQEFQYASETIKQNSLKHVRTLVKKNSVFVKYVILKGHR